MIKSCRNAAASAMAGALYRAPVLERPFARAAFSCRSIPGVRTLFREATDRLAARLTVDGRQFRPVPIGGLVATLDVSDFTVKGSYFSRIPYEPGATRLLLESLGPGGVFVDIGANSGYFTVIAGLRVGPSGRVYAFEPNPPIRARLEHHVAINELEDRVIVSDLAIGATDDERVDFFVSQWAHNSGISSLTPDADTIARGGLSRDRRIQVSVMTFDTWMASARLPRIDVVKIDVEGAELDVVSGMARTLAELKPLRVICETRPGSAAAEWLRGAGYVSRGTIDEMPGGIPNLLFARAGAVA